MKHHGYILFFLYLGAKMIHPVILEVNFGPDNTRLVHEFPNFYNDLFSAMFLGDISDGRPVVPL
jgi:hypothetical protein